MAGSNISNLFSTCKNAITSLWTERRAQNPLSQNIPVPQPQPAVSLQRERMISKKVEPPQPLQPKEPIVVSRYLERNPLLHIKWDDEPKKSRKKKALSPEVQSSTSIEDFPTVKKSNLDDKKHQLT